MKAKKRREAAKPNLSFGSWKGAFGSELEKIFCNSLCLITWMRYIGFPVSMDDPPRYEYQSYYYYNNISKGFLCDDRPGVRVFFLSSRFSLFIVIVHHYVGHIVTEAKPIHKILNTLSGNFREFIFSRWTNNRNLLSGAYFILHSFMRKRQIRTCHYDYHRFVIFTRWLLFTKHHTMIGDYLIEFDSTSKHPETWLIILRSVVTKKLNVILFYFHIIIFFDSNKTEAGTAATIL